MFLTLWATSLIHTVLWAASSPIHMMWHSHGNYCNCQHGKILVAYLMHFKLAVSTSSLLGANCRQCSRSLQWGVAEGTSIRMEGADRSTPCLLKVSRLTRRFWECSVLQSHVKYQQQMVLRKKDLRIITGSVRVLTPFLVVAKECCFLAACRVPRVGEVSPAWKTPVPAALQGSCSLQSQFEAPVLKAQDRLNILQWHLELKKMWSLVPSMKDKRR